MTTSSFFFGTTAAGCPCPEGDEEEGDEEEGDDPLEDDPLDEDPLDEGAAGVTTCEAIGATG